MGLSEKELALLRSILKKYPKITRAMVFGSRAKGTFQNHSDIDIAVSGMLSGLEIEQIAHDLDQLPLPFKFDLICLESAKSKDLVDHIDRVGILIYP